MKKIVTALGLTVAGILATQGVYANDNAKKIAVVKGFLNCNSQMVCVDDNGTKKTKKFLSKSAIATLNNERKNAIFDEDCEADIPRCYSGLWTEPGNGGFMWNTPKYNVNGNIVSANFGKEDGTAYFKLVKENGRWKIDNSKHEYSHYQDKWWR